MLNVGLVGCGRISKRHSELLINNQIKGAKLAAVCDIDERKAEQLGSICGVPYFKYFNEMCEKINLDLVSVLTQSGKHASHVIELSELVKNILVEKPMALTLEDADNMINSCKKNNTKLFIVKQNRFNKPVQLLREKIKNGDLGKINLGTVRVRWCRRQAYYDQDSWRGTWKLDGGVLANQASHHIDLLEWMIGEPYSVFAYANNALADIEAEDTAIVLIKFKSGALGIIEATTATRPKDLEGSLSVLGDKGTIEIGGFAVNKLLNYQFENERNISNNFLKEWSSNPPNVYGYGHKAYYEHVVDCINNNKEQLVNGIEGKKSLILINSIYESIETGEEVIIGSSTINSKLGKN